MAALEQKQENASIKERTPIDHLGDLLQDDMRATNAVIMKRMQSHIPLIPQLAGYLIASGGKRIRPLLTLACAKMCGGNDKAFGVAAAIEFIHSATLLHDDVVDGSDMRRGQESANIVFDNKSSVLVGDFLFARAFELMVESDDIRILDIVARASRIISEGEVLQMSLIGNLSTTPEQYYAVIEAKTAALFSAATHAGSIAAGAHDETANALKSYGHHLGMAFQIIDDLMDYNTDDGAMGKNQGDDFREGKLTLPIIFALQNANADERAFWQRVMHEKNQTSGDFETAKRLIKKHACITSGRAVAQNHITSAKSALNKCQHPSEIATPLMALLDFVVNRDH